MSTPASTLNNTGVMLNSVDTSDNTGYSNYGREREKEIVEEAKYAVYGTDSEKTSSSKYHKIWQTSHKE